MKTTMLKNMMLCLSVAALCACQSAPQKDLRANFGDSVQSNSATQIVDPDAGQTVDGADTLYGPKGNAAMKRYLRDKGKAHRGDLVEDVGG
ncbi:MAG: hypothetical protein ABW148_08760 [Sedimenticola sp.]